MKPDPNKDLTNAVGLLLELESARNSKEAVILTCLAIGLPYAMLIGGILFIAFMIIGTCDKFEAKMKAEESRLEREAQLSRCELIKKRCLKRQSAESPEIVKP